MAIETRGDETVMPVYIPHRRPKCHANDEYWSNTWPDCPRCKINKELYPRHVHPINNDLNVKQLAIIAGSVIGGMLLLFLLVRLATKFVERNKWKLK